MFSLGSVNTPSVSRLSWSESKKSSFSKTISALRGFFF